MKRFLAFLLAAMMVIGCVSALADTTWVCPGCGLQGNTGYFCPSCGTSRPQESDINQSVTGGVSVGDYVFFGRYEQNNNIVDGKEDLVWKVLDVKGDKALLISAFGLHRITFNPTSNKATWANSGIRSWLNKTFYNDAFTSSEQSSIQVTFVDESMDQCCPSYAPKRLGDSTNDKVFLLSYAEMAQYMPTEYDRLCVPTVQAVAEDCNVSDKRYLDGDYKTCWYWLRSPAYNNNLVVVDWQGSFETCYMSHTYGVVRPALWVNVSALH